ncbi:hypothetical protein GCM10007920_10050 [Ciceribacter naphthalenivorans]|uniref:Uncharacterized protein n=2 Tax=Alphaproteobacteria TaxID=28211 RepID=A0A512HEL4_9HYPH|nr:hypothetical protein RNA01_08350 [Ciceribacter naphthalenivorans]GLR21219.1 hypothetical protein GCM10007920_10050 [Ciceribacter naphthalenivorans]GLT04075.1 hypothetical protein GCM10007926_10050 [Sphingomonas psychrolutea]
MPERPPSDHPSLWRRLGPMERTVAAALMAMAIGGILLVVDGIYMKVKAEPLAVTFVPPPCHGRMGDQIDP